MQAGIEPGLALAAGFVQYPLAQCHDHAGLFHDRDEFARADGREGGIAARRGLEAHQGFEGHDLTGGEVHHGLVVQGELVVLDGAAQACFHLQPAGGHGREGLGVEVEAVAPAALGLVHGRIGVADELRGVLAILRVQADADAGAHIHLLAAFEREGLPQALEDGGRHLAGLLRVAQVFEHEDELVATESAQGVFLAHALAQALGHLLEQAVARCVPQTVVDGLEVVEVDEDHAHQGVVALGQAEGMAQALLDQDAVGQVGERVEVGHARQALFGFLQRRDVGEHGHEVGRTPTGAAHGTERHLDHEQLATFATEPDLTLPGTLAQQVAADLVDDVLRLIGEEEIGRAPHGFFFGIAGQGGERGVDGDQHAVAVEHHHPVTGALQGGSVQTYPLLGQVVLGIAVQVGERERQVVGEVLKQGELLAVLVLDPASEQQQVAHQLLVTQQRHDDAAGGVRRDGLARPKGQVRVLTQVGRAKAASLQQALRQFGHGVGSDAETQCVAGWLRITGGSLAVQLTGHVRVEQGHPGLAELPLLDGDITHAAQQVDLAVGAHDGLVDVAEEVVHARLVAQLVLAGLERAHDVFALALGAGDEHQEQGGEAHDQGHHEQVETLLLADGVMELCCQCLRRS